MGWTLEQLGNYLDISLATVHRIEKGTCKIRRPVKMAMVALEKKATKIEKILADE